MIYGAITNSWRQHLEEGDLLDLIQEAEKRGAGHVELCLLYTSDAADE